VCGPTKYETSNGSSGGRGREKVMGEQLRGSGGSRMATQGGQRGVKSVEGGETSERQQLPEGQREENH